MSNYKTREEKFKKNRPYYGNKPKYETPKQMQNLIDKYFNEYCYRWDDEAEKYIYRNTPTLTGLAYHLGLNKDNFLNYRKKEEFTELIDRALSFIEFKTEEELTYSKLTAGVALRLKNHFGWKDKTEIDNNINTSKKLEDFFK